jgi:hypothetical protein
MDCKTLENILFTYWFITQDTSGQPDEEVYRVRCANSSSSGTSVPMKLGFNVFLASGCDQPEVL